MRWASTWSGPFWASSSMTKMAVSFQNLLWLTASTSRPSARSLLATQACGVNVPGVVPVGVVFAQAHDDEAAAACRSSRTRGTPRGRRRRCRCRGLALAAVLARCRSRGTCGRPGPARAPSILNVPSGWLTRPAVFAVAAVASGRAACTRPRGSREGAFAQVAVVVVVDARRGCE